MRFLDLGHLFFKYFSIIILYSVSFGSVIDFITKQPFKRFKVTNYD